jgi:hypothetical protein
MAAAATATAAARGLCHHGHCQRQGCHCEDYCFCGFHDVTPFFLVSFSGAKLPAFHEGNSETLSYFSQLNLPNNRE